MGARSEATPPRAGPVATVESVMTRSVHSTAPGATVLSAVRTMRRHRVSGLPVVTSGGIVKGVLSEKDVVRGLNGATGIRSDRGLLELLLAARRVDHPNLIDACEAWLAKTRVEEVMSAPAVTVAPDATLTDAARQLLRRGVNRLPVLEGRHLVGMVTRQDLLKALRGPAPADDVAGGAPAPEPDAPPEGPGPLGDDDPSTAR